MNTYVTKQAEFTASVWFGLRLESDERPCCNLNQKRTAVNVAAEILNKWKEIVTVFVKV